MKKNYNKILFTYLKYKHSISVWKADVHSMITFNFHPTVYHQNVTSLQHSFQQRSERMSSHWVEDDLTCANGALGTLEPMKGATLVISETRLSNPSIIAPFLAELGHGRRLGWHTERRRTSKLPRHKMLERDMMWDNERAAQCAASPLDPRFKEPPWGTISEAETSEAYSKISKAVVAAMKKQQHVS